MHPRLLTLPVPEFNLLGLHIGPTFTLHTYGLLLAIAFLAGLWVASREAKRQGLDAGRVTDMAIWVLIAGLIGAKVLLVLVDFHYYQRSPRELWSIFQSGGVFYGGLIGGALVAWWYARRHGLAGWSTADVLAPGVVLGQAIGRLGCFAAGCCWGKPTSLPWAVTFTDVYASRAVGTPMDTPLHPSQLYESAAAFLIFAFLLWLLPRKRFHGQVALALRRALLRGSLRPRVPARRPGARLLVRRRALDLPVHRHRSAAGHGRAAPAAAPHAGPRDRLTAAPLAEAHELVVGADEAGQRLDAWLARRLPELSRSRLQALIAAGCVQVDRPRRAPPPASGRAARRGARAARRARRAAARGHPAADRARGRLAARDRQAGGARRPPRRRHGRRHARQRAARARPRPLGRRRRAAAGDRAPARPRHLRPAGRRQGRRAPIGRSPASSPRGRSRRSTWRSCSAARRARAARSTRRSAATPCGASGCPSRAVRGRAARSAWRVEERFDGAALVRVRIHTGRTHQIRVHLRRSAIPSPATPLYGGTRTPSSPQGGGAPRRSRRSRARRCTRRGSPSTTRRQPSGSPSKRRSRRICAACSRRCAPRRAPDAAAIIAACPSRADGPRARSTAASTRAACSSLDVDEVSEPGGVRGHARGRAPDGLRGGASGPGRRPHRARAPVPLRRLRLRLGAARRPPRSGGVARSRCAPRARGGGRPAGGSLEPISTFWTTPGFCDEVMHLFRATGLESIPPRPEADERIEPGTFTLDEAMAMVARGEIREGKTLVALLLEAARRRQ